MASTTRVAATTMRGGGPLEGLYKFVMRRDSFYVTFVIAGTFLGERWTMEFISFGSTTMSGYYLFREDDILGTLHD
ncbi:hypothetical protein QJS10_CPB20g00659 [Acorus calamus]|uniref:Uncharacterized protein n=1 Tax=Acorus calamus TaxID=4465 RepID=A0AAV9C9F8_ACOCL|nr:hypothetical protein QJS10_CPB20g00659 [Acorus calamus]